MGVCGRALSAAAAAAAAAVAVAVAAAVAAAAGVPAAAPAAAAGWAIGSSSRATATDVSAAIPAGTTARILGGRVVSAADADSPAVFFTKIFAADGVRYFCGGSLISRRHVLTRAGCGVRPGDLLRVGGTGIWDGLERRVAAVSTHPDYAPASLLYDVAVLTMADPPTAADLDAAAVVPARLNGWVWTEGAGAKPSAFVVAGFGATDAAAATLGSATLRVGTQRRSDWAACTPATAAIPVPTVAAAQVCTNADAAAATAGLCANDGGGPLARRYTWRGRTVWQLFGVASYWVAHGGGDACALGLPNVYTRVQFVRQWIWEQMV